MNLPATKWPGTSGRRVPLRLVPSDEFVEASAVLTSIDDVARFTDSASELRLQSLRFAMNPAGHVFVVGLPLPAVSGQRFRICNNIAVPAGRRWLPAVDAATVRRVIEQSSCDDICEETGQPPVHEDDSRSARPDDMILWLQTGHWEKIPSDAFTALTRSAVRASFAACRQSENDEGALA